MSDRIIGRLSVVARARAARPKNILVSSELILDLDAKITRLQSELGENERLEAIIQEAIYLILEESSPTEAAQLLVNSAQADREPLQIER